MPLRESKTILRARKLVFWTPVMVWPAGFLKSYKKQTMEYQSDGCLHNGKYPLVAGNLTGGIIINLPTTDVEKAVS